MQTILMCRRGGGSTTRTGDASTRHRTPHTFTRHTLHVTPHACSRGGGSTRCIGAQASPLRSSSRSLLPRLYEDEDELNSDDDEDDDDDGGGGGLSGASAASATGDGENLMLAQFEKVKRVRSQWKIVLRGGTATILSTAYAFARCDADFTY